jgi:hypothetical protein
VEEGNIYKFEMLLSVVIVILSSYDERITITTERSIANYKIFRDITILLKNT